MTDRVDFAISYAGEDEALANRIAARLRELGFTLFVASDARHILVGAEGESFFERLFSEAKQVIVLISSHYRDKDWTRFEWDVIRDRDRDTRFIPVRLDDTNILGLPSNTFHIRFRGHNLQEVVDVCVKRLLLFERDEGVKRPTQYERILNAIRGDSRGALAKAYQLVKDGRKRDPLDDIEVPSVYEPSYKIVETNWSNYSQVRRRCLRVLVPSGLTREELRFNLVHCAAIQFNSYKPEAVSVLAYIRDSEDVDVQRAYTAGLVELAPFGKWDKAEEGVAYNIPTSEFDYTIDLKESYFRSP